MSPEGLIIQYQQGESDATQAMRAPKRSSLISLVDIMVR